MSELIELKIQREQLLDKIREIEETCEGIENKNNAKRIHELNLQQSNLMAQKNNMSSQLSLIENKLQSINNEINTLSGTGIDRILDAIKEQRWFFFKNKPKVLMDKNTGLLWANLDYFPYQKDNNTSNYELNEVDEVINFYNFNEIDNFRVPDCYELWDMIKAKSFPYAGGSNWRIKKIDYWTVEINGDYYSKDLDDKGEKNDISNSRCSALLPCSDICVLNSDYKNKVSPENHVYTEKEKLQFTLNLFIENELWPRFNNDEITDLYKKIYFEKPHILEQITEIQSQIESLESVAVTLEEFDYTILLEKYDIESIDKSIIKYYKAIQQWTDELIKNLDSYEKEKEQVINEFNIISLKLSKKYEDNPNLTQKENELMKERQKYFKNKLSLGINSVKSRILSVKKQADNLENRRIEINEGDNSIYQLALLEQEPRASFSLIAENTAEILNNALGKIQYFETHRKFVVNAIEVWEKWTEDYRVFKTTYKEDMKNDSEDDSIEEEIWSEWYKDWEKLRFSIEEKVQPIIDYGLNEDVSTIKNSKIGVIEKIIGALEEYKDDIDKFYLEERKCIYQKYVFQSGGQLQEKFETESSLYSCVVKFQSSLQDIIFDCKNTSDRIFILNWANSLLDIQIDEILAYISDNDLKQISKEILKEFANLKQKNYDVYLSDAKAYSEEQSRREKEYNSLIFKMRKDLIKQ